MREIKDFKVKEALKQTGIHGLLNAPPHPVLPSICVYVIDSTHKSGNHTVT